MRYLSFILFAAGLCFFSCGAPAEKNASGIDPFHYEAQKKGVGANGAVVSAHPLASQVGLSILKQGGNAVDAAIATQLALAVVYPEAGNIGGGGFMAARLSNGKILALDFREMAPAASRRDMYLDEQGSVIPKKSTRGASSSGVPGTVAGLFESMQYAKLPFQKLIDPAIELAEKGFAISEREANALNNQREEFNQYNSSASAFHRDIPFKAGDTLIQADLALTLKRIRDNGRAGFYEGETAKLIVAQMNATGGYISADDLKNYQAKWREPFQFAYKGHTVISMPMPSSGGLLLNQMLKMVEDRPLAEYGALSPQSIQLMTEVERRAYADRAQYMGDADFYKVPVKELTRPEYLKERMKDYAPGKAGSSIVTQAGRIQAKESEETTHLSVIDKEGNAVAVTTTLNDSYGSRTVVAGAGFILNDEMDDFSVKPGAPNMFGAVGGEANAIAPHKRMLSSMTPTIVLKEDKPFLVTGTPGGTTIPTSVFQTIVNIIDFKLSAEDAVNIPKFHHQWLPDRIDIEKKFPDSTRLALQNMGYALSERNSIGRVELIRILPDGSFEAIADSRGEDSAEVF